jgi:hypothetical protein
MGKRFAIATQKELRFFWATVHARKNSLKNFHRHVPVFHIPDVPHAGAAIKIAFVGHLYIDPLEGMNGWTQT